MFQWRKKNNFKAALLWFLTLAWAVFIFYLSAQPNFPVNFTVNEYQVFSSWAHIILYVVLAFLTIEAAVASGINRRQALVVALAIGAVYGASDEWHQAFVPGREMSLSDWLLDVIAAFLVMFCYSIIYRFKLFDH
ncbi:MAG: VanZ family protein [Candidatus Buchananbacteria bacterium]